MYVLPVWVRIFTRNQPVLVLEKIGEHKNGRVFFHFCFRLQTATTELKTKSPTR